VLAQVVDQVAVLWKVMMKLVVRNAHLNVSLLMLIY
jgi:hypothetical protein